MSQKRDKERRETLDAGCFCSVLGKVQWSLVVALDGRGIFLPTQALPAAAYAHAYIRFPALLLLSLSLCLVKTLGRSSV